VPIIFGIVTRSGFIYLEEFADAEQTLEWDLEALQNSSSNKAILQENNDPDAVKVEADIIAASPSIEEHVTLSVDDVHPLFVADWSGSEEVVLVDSSSSAAAAASVDIDVVV
jgi:Mg-chelatase subunit ChlD